MTHVIISLLALVACLAPQDLAPGAPGDPLAEGNALVDYLVRQGVLANVDVRVFAPAVVADCTGGETPANTQFGLSRRFAGANGFALCNGWLEDVDDDGAPGGNGGCAQASGRIGTGAQCDGDDPVLRGLLAPSVQTLVDGAWLELTFDVLQPATLVVDWSLATFEDPVDATFFDAFGVVFDDGAGGGAELLAGGTTNGGPALGSLDQGWSLLPSDAGEFQSLNFPGASHLAPAHWTGRRRAEIALVPGSAQTLSFHVADSGPTVVNPPSCPAGSSSADPQVQTTLLAGLTLYAQAGPSGFGGVTNGVWIDTSGHPGAVNFPGDLEVQVGGLTPGTLSLLAVSNRDLLPLSAPVVAPWTLLVAFPTLELRIETVASDGIARFDYPLDFSGVTGDFYCQGWSLAPGPSVLAASPGYRLLF